MEIPNVFNKDIIDKLTQRVSKLTSDTQPLWGKMNAAQMLAHCNVTYEMVYEDKHPKPSAFMKLIMKAFVKPIVTNDKPYKKNSQTAPAFKITSPKEFEKEKKRLINYINKTQQLGAENFDKKESYSFGKLSTKEWNNMFYKHLDHHLTQFGV